MEFSFLKKQTRSHRFLSALSQSEINAVLNRYVPRLRSVQIFNVKEHPEVQDEYYEKMDKIVEEARESLKDKVKFKMQKRMDPILSSVIASNVAGHDQKISSFGRRYQVKLLSESYL
jgi:hypothetical protein